MPHIYFPSIEDANQSNYSFLEADLEQVLEQRVQDRKFIDERVAACTEFNRTEGNDFLSEDYKTIVGLEDSKGRIILGPKTNDYA